MLAANRDEYFARPSAPAAWWDHAGASIFGGRDLDKGGTWLGVTRSRRFAVVTNVRDATKPIAPELLSRGFLVRDALASSALPPVVARERFPTFNLIVGEGDDVFYLADDRDTERVAPGVHGLSNHRLDSHWPKVDRALAAFRALERVDAASLFHILADDAAAPDVELPRTGVPLEVERALSPAFVRMPAVAYGTRCSTVVLVDRAGAVFFEERTFDARGSVTGTVRERVV